MTPRERAPAHDRATGELLTEEDKAGAARVAAGLIRDLLKRWTKQAERGIKHDRGQVAALADLMGELEDRARSARLLEDAP
jgi:hypothetical protein